MKTILLWLCAIFVRVPIMLPLATLAWLGDLAEVAWTWCHDNLPAPTRASLVRGSHAGNFGPLQSLGVPVKGIKL